MSRFIDLFSGQAGVYAEARPHYPSELYRYISSLCESHDLAWDCATGNGQAAHGLAPYFEHIRATDASASQLRQAVPGDTIEYAEATASASGLPDGSCDLVTVATALHWFPLEEFYAEAKRVLKPGGLLAVWGYFNASISPEVDAVMKLFHRDVLRDDWAPQVNIIRGGYKDISFPFEEITPPPFEVRAEWNMQQWLRFVMSWSAVQTHQNRTGRNPVEDLYPALAEAWGEPDEKKMVIWPLSLRIGRHRASPGTI